MWNLSDYPDTGQIREYDIEAISLPIVYNQYGRLPFSSQSRRRPCKKPGPGGTTPMLAATGSTTTQAIAPGLAWKRVSTRPRSLYSAVRVSAVEPAGTPALPGRPAVITPDPACTKRQSLWPW